MESVRDAVLALYTELEQLSAEHEELTDTDVREAIHETLNYAFVWGKPLSALPVSYGMFSREGDEAVADIVSRFLARVAPLAQREGLQPGKARLDTLQDESIVAPDGAQFDLFIGQVDHPLPPQPLNARRFQPGDYPDT
jgi:hypothetical protein